MTPPLRLLVIGADAAGMSAAHQALRTAAASGRALTVVALDAGQHTSYSACGIPYAVSGEVNDLGRLVARSAEQHRAAGIDLRLGTRVTHLDLDARLAHVEVDGAAADPVAFDEVVVASGAAPVTPAWARAATGALVPGVRHAKTLDDAAAWTAALIAPGRAAPQRVVVAGGGYIGLEMAEAALRRGCDVTLVTRSRVLSTFADETSERVVTALRAAGVDVREHAAVVGLRTDDEGRATGVVLGDGAVDADHVVLALGVTPATDFLAHTDLLTGRRGALRPDARGVVAPGVWAAGDCCEVTDVHGNWTYAPLGTHANKAGRVVGANVGGGEASFPGVLGSSISRFAHGDVHVEVARTGILERQISGGLDPVVLTTEGTTATGYMPEARPIAIRVCADRTTRRLLSVEIVGGQGAGKRIDTAAAVLHLGGTVDDLAWMDLSYAPPVATAWEILQIAARRLAERF